MKARVLLGTALAAGASVTLACSCFGPQTFCETLNPPFPDPEWWVPDAVVLGVKLADFAHGMDVKILQSFTGTLLPDDTIRVWGDCGLLCRHYPGTWAIGDTVVWGFMTTDLAGNSLCGTSYEQPTDYMISICGVYYLDYANGVVSGPIAPGIGSLPLPDFIQQVNGCLLATGSVGPAPRSNLLIGVEAGAPVIEFQGLNGRHVTLSLTDGAGRTRLSRSWDGTRTRIAGLPGGMYLMCLRGATLAITRKLIVQ